MLNVGAIQSINARLSMRTMNFSMNLAHDAGGAIHITGSLHVSLKSALRA
jgi:hypothetical protein